MDDGASRGPRIVLRDAHDGADHRHLEAWFDADGDLHVDGQDLGPGTAPVSDDGEYEWFQIVRAPHVTALLDALDGEQGEAPLAVIGRYAGNERSSRFEEILRSGVVPVERQIWSG